MINCHAYAAIFQIFWSVFILVYHRINNLCHDFLTLATLENDFTCVLPSQPCSQALTQLPVATESWVRAWERDHYLLPSFAGLPEEEDRTVSPQLVSVHTSKLCRVEIGYLVYIGHTAIKVHNQIKCFLSYYFNSALIGN